MACSPLLVLSLTVLLGSMPAWSKNKPPEIIYPTTHDQQSLEDLFRQPAPAADQPSQPEPAPAPSPAPQTPSSPADFSRGSKVSSPVDSPLKTARNDEQKKLTPEHAPYKVWIWQENGDTLWRIAQKVYGDKDKWPLIYEANKDVIKDPNKIYPKQVLKIPPIDWQP